METYKLSQSDYNKAVGQLRLQVLSLLGEAFSKHGMKENIPGATQAIVKLAEDFSLRCRGVQKPISLEYVRRKRDTKTRNT